MDLRRITLTLVAALYLCLPAASQSRRVVIVQTNAAGDNIQLIDPTTDKVVGEIGGIEVNHGVAAAPARQPHLRHERSRAHS